MANRGLHKSASCECPACLLLVHLSWTMASAISGLSIWPRATPGTPAVLWSWHECPECIRKHCPACVCSLQPGDDHLHPPFRVLMCFRTAWRIELLVLCQVFFNFSCCVYEALVFSLHLQRCPLPADVLNCLAIMSWKCSVTPKQPNISTKWQEGLSLHITAAYALQFPNKNTTKIPQVSISVLFI